MKQNISQTNADRVKEFHDGIGASMPQHPAVPAQETLDLRITLIREEYTEVMQAFQRQMAADDVQADLIHELVDLLYVTYGAILACGVNPDPVFNEVHQANMRKLTGPIREDGKQLKPPDWQPADVAGIIATLRERKLE